MAKRIQRKRTKGWKMPEGAIYVGRPSVFGNPFPVATYGRDEALKLFRQSIEKGWVGTLTAAGYRHFLKGKDLACWCALDQPCHADVLLEIANTNED